MLQDETLQQEYETLQLPLTHNYKRQTVRAKEDSLAERERERQV